MKRRIFTKIQYDKKEKTGKQNAKPLSPEAYIRSRARQLPVHKCYKAVNSYEDREMCIIVIRKHPQGTYTLGAYMIDKWCVLSNSLVFLTNVASVNETLPVVLEVMRQSSEFRGHNFGDASDLFLEPILCVLIKDNPRLLKPFLLEKGPSPEFKLVALELLEHICKQLSGNQTGNHRYDCGTAE